MRAGRLGIVRRVAILGATGSIGLQALDVVRAHPGLRVCAISCRRSWRPLVEAAREHGVRRIALVDGAAADAARAAFDGEVLDGQDGLERLVRESGADVVLNAVVGAAGLPATLAALAAGADVALANKESLVTGGELVLTAAGASGRRILPVDSEHSALLQCLDGAAPGAISGLVITASGGPFRGRSAAELADVTPEQALAHPTWSMGAKITVDSATLMNKGLEVIEAHLLFGVHYDDIEVVVHPQSIVHGLVRFRDGALLAHLGLPDMRVPISYALTYPERAATAAPVLDLAQALRLDFEPPDEEVFRCLALAREAGRTGGSAPAVLNAANEVAVQAFLEGRIRFPDIAAVVEDALARVEPEPVGSLEAVLDADRRARAAADGLVGAAA
jgi:1-deoxy-D-xylulose-5-phosphate reductoisomerase